MEDSYTVSHINLAVWDTTQLLKMWKSELNYCQQSSRSENKKKKKKKWWASVVKQHYLHHMAICLVPNMTEVEVYKWLHGSGENVTSFL